MNLIIYSIRKSIILNKIARNFSPKPFNDKEFSDMITSYMDVFNEKKKFADPNIEKLYALMSKDKFTINLLENYNADFTDLSNITHLLNKIGLGNKIIKSHYVPVSAITFPETLNFLLNYWNGEKFIIEGLNSEETDLFIADFLIKYFTK